MFLIRKDVLQGVQPSQGTSQIFISTQINNIQERGGSIQIKSPSQDQNRHVFLPDKVSKSVDSNSTFAPHPLSDLAFFSPSLSPSFDFFVPGVIDCSITTPACQV